jgi:hypothetical protein
MTDADVTIWAQCLPSEIPEPSGVESGPDPVIPIDDAAGD